MQALIDFDGWRKWKESAQENGLQDGLNPKMASVKRKKAARPSMDMSKESSKGNSKDSSEDTVMAAA